MCVCMFLVFAILSHCEIESNMPYKVSKECAFTPKLENLMFKSMSRLSLPLWDVMVKVLHSLVTSAYKYFIWYNRFLKNGAIQCTNVC